MSTLITVLHVFVCVFLILVILLQAGKGGGGGLAFGMSGSQTVFGGRGSQTFLEKVTSVCAAIFFSTCVALSFMASQGSVANRAPRGPDGGIELRDAGSSAAAVDGAVATPEPGESLGKSPDSGGVVIPATPEKVPKP
jgi:protein translocase SecG subunit